ncbi:MULTISPECIES: Imm21 family immunity protein [Streptomyces]|uniref:Immunity protein 21 of polymorphic toxin system n=1 Tax=Streptomyces luteosporeus TaxID=173856 RepID=A0ABN3TMN3_9ACTN
MHRDPHCPEPVDEWLDSTDTARYALVPEGALAGWVGWEQALHHTSEYADAIPLPGHGDVLTLGGEPQAVTWLPDHLVFARWCYADDDTALAAAVAQAVAGDESWADEVTVELTGGRYLLSDAGDEGEEILSSGEYLPVDLAPGRYRAQSMTVRPDEKAAFLLVRLLPA